MTVTTDGRIVAAAGSDSRAGAYVISPKASPGGHPDPESPANVEFAGPERKTLYIMTGKHLYRIRTNLTGFHVWPTGR